MHFRDTNETLNLLTAPGPRNDFDERSPSWGTPGDPGYFLPTPTDERAPSEGRGYERPTPMEPYKSRESPQLYAGPIPGRHSVNDCEEMGTIHALQ